MGMALRKKPLMDYQTEGGANTYYKFGASRVTGWRKSQEDRLICLPEFHNDFSLFAVFDGHGGKDVSDYLEQNYPSLLAKFLDGNDSELALQLSFLTFDNVLRILSGNALPEETEDESGVIEDLPCTGAVIPVLQSILNNDDAAGTSKEGTESMPESLRKAIASETLKFLTSADLAPEESDEDDKNYDENMESPAEVSEGSDSNHSEEDHESESESESEDEDEDKKVITVEEENPFKGSNSNLAYCGSTGTVVLFNQERAFVANVGDSRCIASVKGTAIELTIDHKPSDDEELIRIKCSGSEVTDDGRIDGGLNMSRAFGDFAHKKKDDIVQPVICDPYVRSIDVNEDLEFIIVATDGVWNSLSNQEIVDYVKIRIKDTNLADICEELFKFILSPHSFGDGTGCDNMSMAIIQFNKKNEQFAKFHICYNDMELDEDISEMESHSSQGFADKPAEMKMLDGGNAENKDEKPSKSTEDSNEKQKNNDSAMCSN